MTRRAVIENGTVTNIIEADPDFELPGKTLVDAGNAGIGWSWDGSTFTPPPPLPPTIPDFVDRRQILTGLALVGWITEAEAEAALTTGARPVAVDTVINSLPEEHQFHARMKWAGFRNAYRNDEMVAALAAVEGKSEQEIDAFFILCAGIE